MSAGYTLAKKYYPKYWNITRLRNLVKAKKLTIAEFEEITEQPYEDTEEAE